MLCCAVTCRVCAAAPRAALIGGSGLSRKLLETARNFPNVAVYIDSDVLQVGWEGGRGGWVGGALCWQK